MFTASTKNHATSNEITDRKTTLNHAANLKEHATNRASVPEPWLEATTSKMAETFLVQLKTCEGTMEPLQLRGEAKRHCVDCGKPLPYLHSKRGPDRKRCHRCNIRYISKTYKRNNKKR